MSYKRVRRKSGFFFMYEGKGLHLSWIRYQHVGSKQNVKIFYVQLLGSLQEGVFFIECYIKIKQETGKHSGYLTPQFNVFFRKADVIKAWLSNGDLRKIQKCMNGDLRHITLHMNGDLEWNHYSEVSIWKQQFLK